MSYSIVMTKPSEDSVPVILPDPADPRLTERVTGIDQTGAEIEINVPVERPLTLYLNAQEIVTMMTIGDYPEYLALGYLLDQNMLKYDDVVTEVEYDDDLQVVVVRTEHHTNFEAKLKKRTQTSGCAQGTAFGDQIGRCRHRSGIRRRPAGGGGAHRASHQFRSQVEEAHANFRLRAGHRVRRSDRTMSSPKWNTTTTCRWWWCAPSITPISKPS